MPCARCVVVGTAPAVGHQLSLTRVSVLNGTICLCTTTGDVWRRGQRLLRNRRLSNVEFGGRRVHCGTVLHPHRPGSGFRRPQAPRCGPRLAHDPHHRHGDHDGLAAGGRLRLRFRGWCRSVAAAGMDGAFAPTMTRACCVLTTRIPSPARAATTARFARPIDAVLVRDNNALYVTDVELLPVLSRAVRMNRGTQCGSPLASRARLIITDCD